MTDALIDEPSFRLPRDPSPSPRTPVPAPRIPFLAKAMRELSHQLVDYRRTWRGSVVSTFLVPAIYLWALGYGLGALVDAHHAAAAGSLGSAGYLSFVGPGLLAATAMQVGVIESTYPIYGGATWHRHYFAVTNTPLAPADLFLGQMFFIAFRLLLCTGAFTAELYAFGSVHGVHALAVLPAAMLTGLAFAFPVAAYTVTLRNDAAIGHINRFVIAPLFLFSGTFVPVSRLPEALRPPAYADPLYQGVALCRGLSTGPMSLGAGLGHAGYLAALLAAGVIVGRRTFQTRLHGAVERVPAGTAEPPAANPATTANPATEGAGDL